MAEMSFAPTRLRRARGKKDQNQYFGITLGDPFEFLKGCTAPSSGIAVDPKQVCFPGMPDKMLSAVLSAYGPVSNLDVIYCDLPQSPGGQLKPTDVLVEIHAASVNPTDCKARKGTLANICPLKLPTVLGIDLSGRVVQAGSSSPFSYGDEVFGRQTLDRMRDSMGGTYAEYAIVDSADLCLKPRRLSHCQAAAVPHACLAAYAALAHVGGLHKRRGQADGAVLVLGGSGGVGSFAVQLARRHFDCFTAATCSARNAPAVRALGADAALDYAAGDFLGGVRGRRFDVVVDCVGGDELWDAARGLLKPHGTFVTLVGAQRPLADAGPLDYPDLLQIRAGYLVRQLSSSLGAAQSYHILTGSQLRSADLPALAALLDGGVVGVPPLRAFALRDVRDAHALAESRRPAGKIVLRVRPGADAEPPSDPARDAPLHAPPAALAAPLRAAPAAGGRDGGGATRGDDPGPAQRRAAPAAGRGAEGPQGDANSGPGGPGGGWRGAAEHVPRDSGPPPGVAAGALRSAEFSGAARRSGVGAARADPAASGASDSPRGRTPARRLLPPQEDALPPPRHAPPPPPPPPPVGTHGAGRTAGGAAPPPPPRTPPAAISTGFSADISAGVSAGRLDTYARGGGGGSVLGPAGRGGFGRPAALTEGQGAGPGGQMARDPVIRDQGTWSGSAQGRHGPARERGGGAAGGDIRQAGGEAGGEVGGLEIVAIRLRQARLDPPPPPAPPPEPPPGGVAVAAGGGADWAGYERRRQRRWSDAKRQYARLAASGWEPPGPHGGGGRRTRSKSLPARRSAGGAGGGGLPAIREGEGGSEDDAAGPGSEEEALPQPVDPTVAGRGATGRGGRGGRDVRGDVREGGMSESRGGGGWLQAMKERALC